MTTGLRLLVVAFCWMTSAYALIASNTFAYVQFLKPRVFPWVNVFAEWHAWLGALWLFALAVLVSDDLERGHRLRYSAAGLLMLCGIAIAASLVWPILPALADDRRSLVVALIALVPPVALGALDLLRFRVDRASIPAAMPADALDTRLLLTIGTATGMHVAVFAILAIVQRALAFEPDLLLTGMVRALWSSIVSHAVLGIAVLAPTALWLRMAGRTGAAARGRWVLAATLLAALVIDRLFAPPLGLTGMTRVTTDLLLGAGVVGTWVGLRLRRAAGQVDVSDGLDLFFGSRGARAASGARVQVRGWSGIGVATVAAIVAAWALQGVAHVADWDDVVSRTGVMAVWLGLFGWAWRRTAGLTVRSGLGVMAAACVMPAMLLAGSRPTVDTRRALLRYATYDPAYRAVDAILRPSPAAGSFNAFLRAHTGLNDVTPAPVSIDLVAHLGAAPSTPPIFLFVIDSLRPDYLSPYNAAVTFTPSLQAFAEEGVVFRRAFTRYGGTGLSVPAIWAGSVLPHKQYVTPFHPMNTLEKLLDANHYRRFVGLDSIMGRLLATAPGADELDRGRNVMDYELCRTLDELEGKLATVTPGTPVFAYSLPQDVHMSRMSRWSRPDGFDGFFAPYAGRIQALDRCFGRFVQTLKRLRLYDDSIIIVTSDHGEMLGEQGQYGHSYHLFPPVIQVPLLMHLPEAARRKALPNAEAPAFSIDITPTIYDALGYELQASPLTGRSLLADRTAVESADDGVVLAASYGAVYAVLGNDGRRLYIADGVKDTDYLFERQTPTGDWLDRPVSPDERAVEQFTIRRHIDATERRFGVSFGSRDAR